MREKYLPPENVQLNQEARVAIDAAVAGSEALLRTIQDMSITTKEGIGNFVTSCDMASQKAIVETIRGHFSQDKILAEESSQDIGDIDKINGLWIIDPVDGTNNLVYERYRSCVSVAYTEAGQPIVAAIIDPFHNELFFAQKGKGAFLNKRKLQVGSVTNLVEAVVTTDPSFDSETTKLHFQLLVNLPQVPPRSLSRGSSVLSICEVAAGKTDLFFHTALGPWDLAGSLLVAEEAGCFVRKLDGTEWDLSSRNIIVGNQVLVEQFLSFNKELIAKSL